MNPVLAAARGTALDLPGLHPQAAPSHTPGSMGLCWLHLASAMPLTRPAATRVPPESVHDTAPRGTGVKPPSLLAPHLLRVVWAAVQCLLPDTPYLTASPPSAQLQCHLPDKAHSNQACCHHHSSQPFQSPCPAVPVACPIAHVLPLAVCVQSTRMTCTQWADLWPLRRSSGPSAHYPCPVRYSPSQVLVSCPHHTLWIS